MKIFKFGGASVKDSNGVENLFLVLSEIGFDKTLVIVSAMGKTTNALELVVKNYFSNKDELQYSLNEVFKFHNEIVLNLFLIINMKSLMRLMKYLKIWEDF